jgi:hypothetical protein
MNATTLTPQEHAQVSQLFEQVMALSPDERQRFINTSAQLTQRVREELLSLLEISPSDAFLASHTLTDATLQFQHLISSSLAQQSTLVAGTMIDRFRIEAVLGTGGMACVYRATDTSSNMPVALKLLQPHTVSPTGIARLQREARILSRLNHPCIGRFLHAGITTDHTSQAFFVMELLDGAQDIVTWTAQSRPSRTQSLEQFIRICDAVHHGHQRGIIHRDIKPGNILVLPDGTPKLIDFGVALTCDLDVSRVTMSTGLGSLIGTFAYMSPEQCEGDPAAIDTRTDVYALGVVLFELLAGQRPHNLAGLSLSQVFATIQSGATNRIEDLCPALPTDLAIIVRKAMNPLPDHRYASAIDLAQDITRFLSNEPIEAVDADFRYHFRLLWARHRLAVAATCIAAASLVIGAATSIFFGVVAHAGEARAVQVLAQEVDARQRFERMSTFLQGAIGSANPYQPRVHNPLLLNSAADPWAEWIDSPWTFAGKDGHKATVEDILVTASKRLELDFANDPEARADLAETLGVSLFRLDRFQEARSVLTSCVELREEHLQQPNDATIRAKLRLAAVLDAIDAPAAQTLYTQAYDASAQLHGKTDAKSLRIHRMLANNASLRNSSAANELLGTISPPTDTSPPLEPAHLLHVAFAASLLDTSEDARACELASQVLHRIDTGECDTDMFARTLARRYAVQTLFERSRNATTVAPRKVSLDAHIAAIDTDAAALFGPYSPEHINTMFGIRYASIGADTTDRSATFFAHTAAAQLKLRGHPHWETGNALRATSLALENLDPSTPASLAAAHEVVTALEPFPQGISTPRVLAECIIAQADLLASNHHLARTRVEALLTRMQAPQAPLLYPQAWTQTYTLHGDCLLAANDIAGAKHAFEQAVAKQSDFLTPEIADKWLEVARFRLSTIAPE